MTNTVWIWFRIFGPGSPAAARLLLSAAKRLDTAHRLFRTVRDEHKRLETLDSVGYEFRRTVYETVGMVEIAVIALRRVIVLAQRIKTHLNLTTPLPLVIVRKTPAITAPRDSFEHIDERALGLINGQTHPDALSVFEFGSFLNGGVLYHGPFGLDIERDVTDVFLALRQFLRDVAGEIGTFASARPTPAEATTSSA